MDNALQRGVIPAPYDLARSPTTLGARSTCRLSIATIPNLPMIKSILSYLSTRCYNENQINEQLPKKSDIT